MRIFLTGANGWIGSAIVVELLRSGHEVVGLVRSPEKAERLTEAGAQAVIGDLSALDLLRAGAEDADGVIHTAFGLDFANMERMAAEDRLAIEAFGDVYAGSDRPILATGGFLVGDGTTVVETDRPAFRPDFPRASEQAIFELADRGIQASIVRNPRSVHGKGETHGFVPMFAAVARDKGVSAWVEAGGNRWPAVHVADSARVYARAIERGTGGGAYHAVAEEGVPFRAIAEAIGRQLGLPARSIPAAEAASHFGWLASFATNDGPASSRWTQETLGWNPQAPGLVADIEQPDYQGRLVA